MHIYIYIQKGILYNRMIKNVEHIIILFTLEHHTGDEHIVNRY